MTQKEHAEEIWLAYYELVDDIYSNEAAKGLAKIHSLIAVDAMIDFIDPEAYGLEMDLAFSQVRYLEGVKKEIELL